MDTNPFLASQMIYLFLFLFYDSFASLVYSMAFLHTRLFILWGLTYYFVFGLMVTRCYKSTCLVIRENDMPTLLDFLHLRWGNKKKSPEQKRNTI